MTTVPHRQTSSFWVVATALAPLLACYQPVAETAPDGGGAPSRWTVTPMLQPVQAIWGSDLADIYAADIAGDPVALDRR